MKTPPLPQKKSAFQENASVMGAMQKKSPFANIPQIDKAKQQLTSDLQANNMTPENAIQLGNMAKEAIRDKNLYPLVKDIVLKKKIAEPQEIAQGIDYKLLSKLVAMGALAHDMKGGAS